MTEVIASVRELRGRSAYEFIRANSGVVEHLVGWSLTTTEVIASGGYALRMLGSLTELTIDGEWFDRLTGRLG